MIITSRRLGLVAAAAIVFAACGSDDSASTATNPPPPATDAPVATEPAAEEPLLDEAAMDDTMELPEFAEGFTLAVSSDAADSVVAGDEVAIDVVATGYELSCDWTGKTVNENFGHYHVLLDNSLIDMKCDPTATVSMQNVAPGTHTIAVVPALNDHTEILHNMGAIDFTYEPAAAMPEIVDAAVTADPVIRIVSPQAGDVVSGDFDIVIEVENYELSCDLFGKPGLLGYGHYHMHLDSTDGPMMGMGSMMGMSCSTTFAASTVGLESGSAHSVIAVLADNGHAPLMNAVAAEVEVTVG